MLFYKVRIDLALQKGQQMFRATFVSIFVLFLILSPVLAQEANRDNKATAEAVAVVGSATTVPAGHTTVIGNRQADLPGDDSLEAYADEAGLEEIQKLEADMVSVLELTRTYRRRVERIEVGLEREILENALRALENKFENLDLELQTLLEFEGEEIRRDCQERWIWRWGEIHNLPGLTPLLDN